MKLTEELKQKIDAYFESKSEEEVYEILKSYGLKEEKTYTLDELKSEVDKFRTYLLNVCVKNICYVNVEFKSSESLNQFSKGKSIKVETRINIF